MSSNEWDEITYPFLNFNGAFAGKSKLNAVSTLQSKVKQAWFPWCLMPIGTIQHLNRQRTVLTNNTVLVASLVYGEWRWKPQQNLLISGFIPCMSASANECRSIGSCSSSGLCAGLLITGFPLLAATQTVSLWHKIPVRGYQNNFQEHVLKYKLSMLCPNCLTCPSIRTDPEIPPSGYSVAPRTRV